MGRERVNGSGSNGGSGDASAPQPPSALSIAEIRQLITLMNGSDIEEIAIEQESESLKLTLRKPAPTVVIADDGDGAFETIDIGAANEEEVEPKSHEISAPLVGVFRASLKPGGKPLAQVGDIVRQGQVIGIIESLNVPNEVEALSAGRISDILAQDGQPVEYGQPLLVIERQLA